jgi:hypothetical protein
LVRIDEVLVEPVLKIWRVIFSQEMNISIDPDTSLIRRSPGQLHYIRQISPLQTLLAAFQ